MPKVTKNFLETYGKALDNTLIEYMKLKPNYSDEGRVKLTLQFMIEFNCRLLSAIEAPYLNQMNSKKRELLLDEGVSNLLLANSEPDCENGLDYSSNILIFYKKVSQNIENDPLKKYHEDLRSSLFFYKPASIVSMGLLAVFLFLSHLYSKQEGDMYYPNDYFTNWYLMTAPFAACFFAMFISTHRNLAYSKNALENLQCFAQQETYALPGTNHAESVENIKRWFEDRSVFFQPSMAEMVDKNRVELSLGQNQLMTYS